MDTATIQTQLEKFLKRISATIHVENLIIFGSYAWGKPTEESDIDVIVVSDDFKKIRIDKRDTILENSAQGITPKIQPWGFTRKEFRTAGKFSTLGHARDSGIRFL